MNIERRDFLKLSAAAGVVFALGSGVEKTGGERITGSDVFIPYLKKYARESNSGLLDSISGKPLTGLPAHEDVVFMKNKPESLGYWFGALVSPDTFRSETWREVEERVIKASCKASGIDYNLSKTECRPSFPDIPSGEVWNQVSLIEWKRGDLVEDLRYLAGHMTLESRLSRKRMTALDLSVAVHCLIASLIGSDSQVIEKVNEKGSFVLALIPNLGKIVVDPIDVGEGVVTLDAYSKHLGYRNGDDLLAHCINHGSLFSPLSSLG
jgi:hypothetical protein